MAESRVTREDVESAVGARRELGEELEPAVVDAFLDRVERAIDARVDERLQASKALRRRSDDGGPRLALAIVSLATGIPITAIAADSAEVLGILIAWIGIAAVNVAYAFGRGRD